jgi:hypothetical protein
MKKARKYTPTRHSPQNASFDKNQPFIAYMLATNAKIDAPARKFLKKFFRESK